MATTTKVPPGIGQAYSLSTDRVITILESSAEGLFTAEAERRLAIHGPNALPVAAGRPGWQRFLAHFDDVLIYILLAAAVLKALMGDWVEFAVIFTACFAIALTGFIQEGRAERALSSIEAMLALEAIVFRDGAWVTVGSEDLVPGDIVRVRSGDRIPADLRIISSTNLQVDEAALTGESVPASKGSAEVRSDAELGDRSSMLYSGTIVSVGNGEGIVTAIGADTEIGRITTLVSEVEALDTPLTKQLAHLGKQISLLIGLMAFVMLLAGRLLHNNQLGELLSAAIGFAVAAVPEGLPALVTITLALGVQQMARRHAIVRKMPSIESLGAVSTICSDKTGTLTQNEMTATTVLTRVGRHEVTGNGYSPDGEISHEDDPVVEVLVRAAGLCNNAQVQQDETGWKLVGQPTEGALKVLSLKSKADLTGFTRLAEIPFESTHKFSATVDEAPDSSCYVHVTGAPDRLLERSTYQLVSGQETEPLNLEIWDAKIEELSRQGRRVLGIAVTAYSGPRPVEIDLADIHDLTFVGVVGIVDPPRPEVRGAIAEAHAAGVNVKMITGDHAGTALAIARELGIGSDHESLRALTGAELEEMSQEELRQVAPDVDVYARTSPEHKIRIVRALQSNHQIVAMTGDGVNDAPSITRADVGVAMGIKGTEATKEAADIVLSDDNFATITSAVEEGRRIYDNIRKSVVFLLPTNGAQSLVILAAVLLGFSLPLSPVQILWVNLITAVTLSLPLAVEPAEPGIMGRSPRSTKEQVLSLRSLLLVLFASVVIGGATLAAYLLTREWTGDYAVAQTTAVTVLAAGQLAYLFNCRILSGSSFSRRAFTGNRMVWYSAGILVIAQLIFIYAPFMHPLFDSAPIGGEGWGLALGFSVGIFVFIEAFKLIQRRIVGSQAPSRTLV